MKTHVVKTTPDASLAEAADLMDIYQVNSLPVVDPEGRLCGIISEHDIAKLVCPAGDCNSTVAAGWQGLSRLSESAACACVAEAMEPEVVWLREDAAVESSIGQFFVNDITRLPVLSCDGDLVGTLNRIDVLQALFERTLTGVPE